MTITPPAPQRGPKSYAAICAAREAQARHARDLATCHQLIAAQRAQIASLRRQIALAARREARRRQAALDREAGT